jgi:hypothetical protein
MATAEEEPQDIIRFYNLIFIPKMKEHLIAVCAAGSAPASALPQVTSLSMSGQASITAIFAVYLANSSYTGPVLNLRRSSEQTTTDFFADSFGNLGTSLGATGLYRATNSS